MANLTTMISLLSNLTVTTKRLQIRRLEEPDLKHIYLIHSDPDVNQYLPYDTWLNWEDAQHWFASIEQRRSNNDAEQFVIVTRDSETLVGTCIVFNYESQTRSAEFGYVLAKTAWKKGFMLEAMLAFIPALYCRLGLSSLVANVDVNNIRSLQLLEKMNFIKAGKREEDSKILQHLIRTF